MKELKRCPFCGKKPVWHVVGEANDLLKFGCPDGCVEWIQAFTKPYYENALQTLEIRWNRRAAPENKPRALEELRIENAQLRAVITESDPDFFKRKCRVCGCDWDHPCNDYDYWVEEDLCSECARKPEGSERP